MIAGSFLVEEVPNFMKFIEEFAAPLSAMGYCIRTVILKADVWVKWPRERPALLASPIHSPKRFAHRLIIRRTISKQDEPMVSKETSKARPAQKRGNIKSQTGHQQGTIEGTVLAFDVALLIGRTYL